jgi:hypothetical protein
VSWPWTVFRSTGRLWEIRRCCCALITRHIPRLSERDELTSCLRCKCKLSILPSLLASALALANSGSFLDPKNINPTNLMVVKAFSYAMKLSRWRYYYIIKLKIIGNSGGDIIKSGGIISATTQVSVPQRPTNYAPAAKCGVVEIIFGISSNGYIWSFEWWIPLR